MTHEGVLVRRSTGELNGLGMEVCTTIENHKAYFNLVLQASVGQHHRALQGPDELSISAHVRYAPGAHSQLDSQLVTLLNINRTRACVYLRVKIAKLERPLVVE